MAREDLISIGDRPMEERQAIGRKGGLRAAEVKREKKRTIELVDAMLRGQIKYDGKIVTREQAYVLAAIKRGIETGKVDLLELIARLRGELVNKNEVEIGNLPVVLTEEFMGNPEKFGAKKGKKRSNDPLKRKRGRPPKIKF